MSNGHNGGGHSGQGSWNQSNHQSGHPVHMNHNQTFNPTRHPGFQNIYGSPAGPGGLMHPSDPNFVFRDTSLDHFKVKLGMTTNQDGSVEIRVDKDKVEEFIYKLVQVSLDRSNNGPRWIENNRDKK